MQEEPSRVVILGGGVCGLYAARVLTRAGVPVTILERQPHPGGLASGNRRGENFYDLGVHMLHAFDRPIFEDIRSIMGDERIEVNLDAKIRWAGSFYRYPLQFQDMIRGVNPFSLAYFVLGLFWAQFLGHVAPGHPKNAEEALIQLYGYPLYAFFFREFTHRYWGIHPTGLSATFIKSKMPRLSAVDVIKRALAKIGLKEKPGRAVESALLQETLHYSANGAEALIRKLCEAIEKDGATIVTGAEVTGVKTVEGRARAIRYRVDGQEHEVACEECISTIPLPALARSLDPAPPPDVIEATERLRFKALAVYGLLVNKPKAIDALYIYYRDHDFHRVGEPKNAGLRVTPPDHTVLIVETTCEIGDDKWNGTDEAKRRIFADLQAEGICRPEEVVETHILRCETGYPIFSLGFEPHFERVMEHLKSFPNLQSTGRQGAFRYPNMHVAMRMGADAATAALSRLNPKQ